MLKAFLGCVSACALAAAANLAASSAAFAADPTSDTAATSGTGMEEVVVTARRIVENMQSVPVAVTALSGRRIQELVLNNIQDLNKISPSLQSSSCSGMRNCFNPTIRGQGTAAMTGQASVAVYFADAPTPNPSYYDLQSLQVLKGPQGTLFGETATGGALIYTPTKPSPTFSAYGRVQFGNYNYYSGEGAVGGPLLGDKVMFRIAGQFRKRNGFTQTYPSYAGGQNGQRGVNVDNVDTADLRLSFVVKPINQVENYTIFSFDQTKSHGTGQFVYYANASFLPAATAATIPANNPTLAAQWIAFTGLPAPAGQTWGQLVQAALAKQLLLGPRALANDYSRDNETQFFEIINTTRFDITSNITLKNIFNLYWQRQRGAMIDTDGTDLPAVDTLVPENPLPAGTINTNRQLAGNYAWTGGWPARNMTDEVQISGKSFADRLQWQVGFFMKNLDQRDFIGPNNTIIVLDNSQGLVVANATCSGTYLVTPPCTTLTRSVSRSTGLYGQATFAVLTNLHFTAGYRRSSEYRRTDTTAGPLTFYSVNGVQVPLITSISPFPNAGIVSLIVPKAYYSNYTLSLDWQVNPDNLLYVASRKGYKGGGINNNAPLDSPNRTFGPENLTDLEIGLKSDWEFFGVRGRTDVDYYHDWYDHIQRTSAVPGQALTFTQNLANGLIDGVEFETSVIPSEWFDVSFFAAWTQPKYTTYTENSTCASQFYRPQCSGTPTGSLVVIDHARGLLTITTAGGTVLSTTEFQPDVFRETSKWRWGVQPAVHLKPWLGEDITLKANVYYRSSGQWGTADANTSLMAGNNQARQTVFGIVNNVGLNPGYTLADLRIDWRHIRGTHLDAAFQVTNIANTAVMVGGSGGLTIAGITPAIANEPRMFYFELSYAY